MRQFEAALGSLVPTLNGLKKYEANFSTDAKAVLAVRGMDRGVGLCVC